MEVDNPVPDGVNRPLLPDDLPVATLILLLKEHPWGTWVFPFGPALGRSRVIQKLGTIEQLWNGAPAVVVHQASNYLLTAVTAAGTVPASPGAVQTWLDALGFLCSEPSQSLFHFVVIEAILRPLRRRAGSPVPPQPCRSDQAPTRRILTDAAELLPLSPGRVRAIRDAGYDSRPLARPGPRVQPSEFRVIDPGAAEILEVLSHLQGAVPTGLREPKLCCLVLLTRSEKGCLELLRRLSSVADLVGTVPAAELAGRALRHLYAEECRGDREPCSDGPFVPLECVAALRGLLARLGSNRRMLLGRLLPVDRDVLGVCRLPPPAKGWCRSLEEQAAPPPQTDAELRKELLGRVPWLARLPPDIDWHVTGSLLTEAVARPGADSDGLVGDVDIFCPDSSRLEELARAVAEVVPSATVSSINASRWRLEPREAAPRPGHWCSRGDIYVNNMATVRTYHMPHVRAAYRWNTGQLLMFPSALVGLATGVNVDYMGSCGARNSYEVLERKWRAGFSALLSTREYFQFAEYLYNVATSQEERQSLEAAISAGTEPLLPTHNLEERQGFLDAIDRRPELVEDW
jgi:hypothetical protein